MEIISPIKRRRIIFYLYNKNSEPNEITGKFTLITDYVETTISSIDAGEITE